MMRSLSDNVNVASATAWPIQAIRRNELRGKSAGTLLAEAEDITRIPPALRPQAWAYLGALALEGLDRAAALEACATATPVVGGAS